MLDTMFYSAYYPCEDAIVGFEWSFCNIFRKPVCLDLILWFGWKSETEAGDCYLTNADHVFYLCEAFVIESLRIISPTALFTSQIE